MARLHARARASRHRLTKQGLRELHQELYEAVLGIVRRSLRLSPYRHARLEQQLDGIDAERVSQPLHDIERHIAAARLQPVQIDAMQVGFVGEPFLAPAQTHPAPPDIVGEGRAQSACREGFHSRTGEASSAVDDSLFVTFCSSPSAIPTGSAAPRLRSAEAAGRLLRPLLHTCPDTCPDTCAGRFAEGPGRARRAAPPSMTLLR